MFFRNLTMYRFPASLVAAFQPVEQFQEGAFWIDPPPIAFGLVGRALKPVGPLEMTSRGFVPPYGAVSAKLIEHGHGGNACWLTVGGEDKILPAAVLNARLSAKLDELEKREGRRPGGKTRKRLRDDLLHELLPTAFVKPSRTDLLVDLRNAVLYVDTPSRKRGDEAVSQVRAALGSFPALPLNAQVAPRSVMTGWLSGEPLPAGLSLGEACELRDPIEGGAVARFRDQDLHSDEIAHHLEAGKQVTRLELLLDDRLAFVLGDDLVIRRLRFLEGAVDALENTEREDLRAELDARMALQAAELTRLFRVLESALQLSNGEG